jgi:hypothetical protein
MKVWDYKCRRCGRVQEHFTKADRKEQLNLCCEGVVSDRLFPALHVGRFNQLAVAANDHGPDEMPPHILDTRPLGEGMTDDEWAKNREHAREERIHNEVVADMGKDRIIFT